MLGPVGVAYPDAGLLRQQGNHLLPESQVDTARLCRGPPQHRVEDLATDAVTVRRVGRCDDPAPRRVQVEPVADSAGGLDRGVEAEPVDRRGSAGHHVMGTQRLERVEPAVPLDECHPETGPAQQDRGGRARDARPDDHHVKLRHHCTPRSHARAKSEDRTSVLTCQGWLILRSAGSDAPMANRHTPRSWPRPSGWPPSRA